MEFVKESFINAPPEVVFAFHELEDAFERLVPPWESVKIIQKADISKVGSQAILEQSIFGLIKQKWIAEHTAYDPPNMFEDTQVSGPFKKWVHKHHVIPLKKMAPGSATKSISNHRFHLLGKSEPRSLFCRK